MRLCVLDFESFFSTTHSLTKMDPISYVMHPDTEIISVAAKFDGGETRVLFGEDNIRSVLSRIDWSDTLVVGHNMSGFDSLILAWRFGVKPKMWGCTMAMSRPFFQTTVGGSLKKVAAALGVGEKGSLEATNTKGKRYEDFTPEEIEAMAEYNKLDVDLCYGIFKKLAPKTSKMEMRLIDLTTRMLVEPTFVLDVPLLERTLEKVKQDKVDNLRRIAAQIGVDISIFQTDEDVVENASKILASSAKFSKLLESLGVAVPMKQSPSNPDKMIPALSKTDEAFLALQDHDNEIVSLATRARLDVKSTLLETRIQRFLDVNKALGGKMPIFLNYYAATTGRWGGAGGGLNQQNLPRIPRDKDGNIIDRPTNALRISLRAPEGHKVVVCDLSGIELRVNHFLWKVPSSMALYRADPAKADLYKDFASKLYNVDVASVTKAQRQVGKVAHLGLGYSSGAKTFQKVAKLMGGVEITEEESAEIVAKWRQAYVEIKNGWRLCGNAITHIYNGDYGLPIDPWGLCVTHEEGIKTPIGMVRYPKLEFVEDEKSFYYGEGRNRARLTGPKCDENCIARGTLVLTDAGWKPIETVQLSDKVHDGVSFTSHGGVVFKSVQQCVTVDGVHMTDDHEVLDESQSWVAASEFPRPYRPDLRDVDCGILRRVFHPGGGVDVQVRVWEPSDQTTQNGSEGAGSGWGSKLRMRDNKTDVREEPHARDDQTPSVRSVAFHARPLPTTLAQGVEKLRSAWHNGVRTVAAFVREFLGGYGAVVPAGAGLGSSEQQFRLFARELPVGYQEGEHAEQAQQLRCGHSYACSGNRDFEVNAVLPPESRAAANSGSGQAKGYEVFDILNAGPRSRFVVLGSNGPFIVHNCVQHLARCIMAEQLLKISKQYKVVHTVHDEVVCIVPEDQAQACLDFMVETMSTPPTWWPELVLSAEGDVADSYGEAK